MAIYRPVHRSCAARNACYERCRRLSRTYPPTSKAGTRSTRTSGRKNGQTCGQPPSKEGKIQETKARHRLPLITDSRRLLSSRSTGVAVFCRLNLAAANLLKGDQFQLLNVPFLAFVERSCCRAFLDHLAACIRRRQRVSTKLLLARHTPSGPWWN